MYIMILYKLGTIKHSKTFELCMLATDGKQKLLFIPKDSKSDLDCILEKMAKVKCMYYDKMHL